jgi:hypothetical protein
MGAIRSVLALKSSEGVVVIAHDAFLCAVTPVSEASNKQPERIWPLDAKEVVRASLNVPGENIKSRSGVILYRPICESTAP